jgi:hypothetical protein
MPKEACCPECLVPTVEHAGGSVMILGTISWYSAGPLNGRITTSDYMDILGKQVHPMVQMFFRNSDADLPWPA